MTERSDTVRIQAGTIAGDAWIRAQLRAAQRRHVIGLAKCAYLLIAYVLGFAILSGLASGAI